MANINWPLDPAADAEWEALFRKWFPMVHDFAMRLTQSNDARSQDIAQDTFIAARQKWGLVGKLDPTDQKSWLRGVAYKKFVDWLRLDERLGPLPDETADILQVPDDVCERAMDRADLQRCWQIMQQMPKKRFQVACFSIFFGMKDKEIADVLGIADGTVRSHLSQAKSYIKERLDELGLDSDEANPGMES